MTVTISTYSLFKLVVYVHKSAHPSTIII